MSTKVKTDEELKLEKDVKTEEQKLEHLLQGAVKEVDTKFRSLAQSIDTLQDRLKNVSHVSKTRTDSQKEGTGDSMTSDTKFLETLQEEKRSALKSLSKLLHFIQTDKTFGYGGAFDIDKYLIDKKYSDVEEYDLVEILQEQIKIQQRRYDLAREQLQIVSRREVKIAERNAKELEKRESTMKELKEYLSAHCESERKTRSVSNTESDTIEQDVKVDNDANSKPPENTKNKSCTAEIAGTYQTGPEELPTRVTSTGRDRPRNENKTRSELVESAGISRNQSKAQTNETDEKYKGHSSYASQIEGTEQMQNKSASSQTDLSLVARKHLEPQAFVEGCLTDEGFEVVENTVTLQKKLKEMEQELAEMKELLMPVEVEDFYEVDLVYSGVRHYSVFGKTLLCEVQNAVNKTKLNAECRKISDVENARYEKVTLICCTATSVSDWSRVIGQLKASTIDYQTTAVALFYDHYYKKKEFERALAETSDMLSSFDEVIVLPCDGSMQMLSSERDLFLKKICSFIKRVGFPRKRIARCPNCKSGSESVRC